MRTIIFLLALCISSLSIAQKNGADAIIGTWLTEAGKAKVQIYKSGDKYYGKIVWLKTPNYEDGTPKIDKNNPDKTKQKNPIMGLNLIKGFVFDEENHWKNGSIYDPENGKTYSCKIEMKQGGWLEVRGFIGISLLGRTQTWYRVSDVK